MDADVIITDDLCNYFNAIGKYDVAIPFSTGVSTLCPWRRLLAGNVFIKNNSQGRKFISKAKDYILNNIYKPQAWTLDQNALTYSFEYCKSNVPNLNIGNCNRFIRPTMQGPIHKQIETV